MDFEQIISSEEELRAVLGYPSHRAVGKTTTILDEHCRRFIARSPFVLVASADGTGNVDISPKGDPVGFVHVLDERTLAIPDRPGNRRIDTFRNVLQNPKIGLLLIVPGKRETLRISGNAMIVRDAKLRASMAMNGKLPNFVLVVSVLEAFFHCSKCIIRSKLWESNSWPSLDGLPSLAEAMVKHANLTESVPEMQTIIDNDARDRLY
jgi:uncharacterized protein